MAGSIVSILASRKTWKRERFASWLTKHKYKSTIVEEGEYHHAPQSDAKEFDRVRTLKRGRLLFRIGFKGRRADPQTTPARKPWYDESPIETIKRIWRS